MTSLTSINRKFQEKNILSFQLIFETIEKLHFLSFIKQKHSIDRTLHTMIKKTQKEKNINEIMNQ